MFGKKNKKEELNFKTDDYVMPEFFDSNKLVVANLESITNETEFPTVLTTNQKYIFEEIKEKDKLRYKEVFTGFITDKEENCHFFNYPYPVNIIPLKEVVPTIIEKVPKYALLLLLNEVNTKLNMVMDVETVEEKTNNVCVIFKDEEEEKQFSKICEEINHGKREKKGNSKVYRKKL
jgi:hypothetical protein